MASETVTLKGHDLRSLVEQFSESRAAVAELVEFVVKVADYWNYPGGLDAIIRDAKALSRHQAGLGKGVDRGSGEEPRRP